MIGRSGLHIQHVGLTGAHRHHAHEKNVKDPASSEEQDKKIQEGGEETDVKPSLQTTRPSTPAEADLTYEQLKQVQQLQTRDREVRAHEAAHAAVGGQYAGSPSYSYQKGPDGRSYAVGGEVSISVSAEPTPEATIRKMEIVRHAALAPAEPSPQDRQVAQAALATKAQAIAELATERSEASEADTPLRIKGQ